jgi:hypothetical protein
MECISSVSETVSVADNVNGLRKSGNKSCIDKADVAIRHKSMLHSFAVKVSYLPSIAVPLFVSCCGFVSCTVTNSAIRLPHN